MLECYFRITYLDTNLREERNERNNSALIIWSRLNRIVWNGSSKDFFCPKEFRWLPCFWISRVYEIPSWTVFNLKTHKGQQRWIYSSFWYFANWIGAPLEVIFRLRDYYFLHFPSKRYQVQTKTGYKIIMHKYVLKLLGWRTITSSIRKRIITDYEKKDRQIVWITFSILNCMQRKRIKHWIFTD